MKANITEEVGKYLRGYAVDCFMEEVMSIDSFTKAEGEMRDRCYGDMGDLFDDAMDEFNLSDVIDDVCEKLKQEIKDLLYERTGDCADCERQCEIDDEISKLEKRIEVLYNLDDTD